MLDWDGSFVDVGGQLFRAQFGTGDRPGPDAMLVYKTREMIETLHAIVDRVQPRTILELGILHGGSTALLASLAPEAKVVALEINTVPPPRLERFLSRTGQQDRVRAHYGVDQADRARLREIIDQEFGGTPIDFVIDDASHELGRSRESLDIILPLVRPGGCYFIEDWSWGHLRHSPNGQMQRPDAWPDGRPLTPLVLEMVMAVGSNTGVLTDVDLDYASARGWRGDAELDPATFRLRDAIYDADSYLTM